MSFEELVRVEICTRRSVIIVTALTLTYSDGTKRRPPCWTRRVANLVASNLITRLAHKLNSSRNKTLKNPNFSLNQTKLHYIMSKYCKIYQIPLSLSNLFQKSISFEHFNLCSVQTKPTPQKSERNDPNFRSPIHTSNRVTFLNARAIRALIQKLRGMKSPKRVAWR